MKTLNHREDGTLDVRVGPRSPVIVDCERPARIYRFNPLLSASTRCRKALDLS